MKEHTQESRRAIAAANSQRNGRFSELEVQQARNGLPVPVVRILNRSPRVAA